MLTKQHNLFYTLKKLIPIQMCDFVKSHTFFFNTKAQASFCLCFFYYHNSTQSLCQTQKSLKRFNHLRLFAEATRFELVVRLPVRQFSKLVVSATHPNFHFRFASANIASKFELAKRKINYFSKQRL